VSVTGGPKMKSFRKPAKRASAVGPDRPHPARRDGERDLIHHPPEADGVNCAPGDVFSVQPSGPPSARGGRGWPSATACLRARPDRRVNPHARRGVAKLELALILPTLMLVALGAVDFGRFAARAVAVHAGARAGAGYGIVNPYTSTTQATWTANLNQAVTDEMQSMFDSRFGASSLVITAVKTNDAGNAWRVRVTVSFPFQTVINWPKIPHKITITESVEMRGIR